MNKIASWSSTTGNNYVNNNGNPPYNNNPYANTTATSNFVYRLNGNTGDKSGLGITLKVMAGDIVNIYAKSFYHTGGATPSNTYLINSALNSFIAAFAGTPAVATSGHGATAAALQGSSATSSGVNNWVTNGVPNPSPNNIPRAYVNWILFNNQFIPIASNCGYDLVSTSQDAVKSHNRSVSIGTSGYLYVYCSNESNIDVFFDNLQVIQTRGPLLEATDYYPFGLSMASISDKAIKTNYAENKYKYNGKELQSQEFNDGSGMQTYDYGVRMQDPQIGRWFQIDPSSENMRRWSPYVYAFNNPSRFIDPDGMTPIDGPRVPYHSADAAAVAWGKYYGATTLRNHTELSSIIYKQGDYYYFTTALYFKDNKINMGQSPTIEKSQKTLLKGSIPENSIIIGNIHSHPWTGELKYYNYTFSNNNRVGVVKYDIDDEKIMTDAPKFIYYLYNAIGQVRVRRPEDYYANSSGASNQQDETIASGLPWDPDALDPETGKPMGNYREPGKVSLTPSFDGNGYGVSPADPATEKKAKISELLNWFDNNLQQQRAERKSIL